VNLVEQVLMIGKQVDRLRSALVRIAARDLAINGMTGATAWEASGALFPRASFEERKSWLGALAAQDSSDPSVQPPDPLVTGIT